MGAIPPNTSGIYDFFPSNADIMLEAFGRIGMEGPVIDRGKIFQAVRSLNYLLASWQNRGVNIWERDLQTINLTTAATYAVPASTVSILSMYYTTVVPNAANIDRIMVPMGEEEYAELPNKLQPGIPTRFWYQKLQDGLQQVTIWQPPISTEVAPNFLISYYRLRRTQTAAPTMGQQPDLVSRALDALAAEFAVRLAEKFKPEMVAMPNNRLERSAKEAWAEFASYDRDDADLMIQPQLSGYWR